MLWKVWNYWWRWIEVSNWKCQSIFKQCYRIIWSVGKIPKVKVSGFKGK